MNETFAIHVDTCVFTDKQLEDLFKNYHCSILSDRQNNNSLGSRLANHHDMLLA